MEIQTLKIKKTTLKKIATILGQRGYSIQNTDRVNYSRDASFRSAIKAYYSRFENCPSVICWPESPLQVARLIKLSRQQKIPVTPYSGGSGVCGGAQTNHQGIVIDTKRINQIVKIDEAHLFVEVGAGILGMELEKRLNRRGFTLGHFPTSILNACLGGFLATRSAGQFSAKYGKIEDMIIDLEFVDGRGQIIQTSDVSRLQGTDLTQMIVGSEGTLGIITKARLKIYPQPQARLFKACTFDNLENGIEAVRRIMQTGIKPDALRLYDALETALVLSKISRKALDEERLADTLPEILINSLKSIKSSAFHLVFKSHRIINEFFKFSWKRCVLVTVLEGHQKIIDEKSKIIGQICQDLNAEDIGEDIASHWYQHRYSVAYEGANLFQDGAFYDIMEVATTWDHLESLYKNLKKRLEAHCFILTHIAHTYEEGAGIYLTLISPLRGPEQTLKRYDKIWKVALDTTQRFHGSISHHHGIGRLKTPHLPLEWGNAVTLYKKFKTFFDPDGILNPGVLINNKHKESNPSLSKKR